MRLIDADALQANLKQQYENVFGKARKTVNPDDFFITREFAYRANVIELEQKAFFEYLKTIPTIEAESVKRGRWVETEESVGWMEEACAKCSVCGELWVLDEFGFDYFKTLWNFCPCCGAKMDGVT